MEAGNEGDRQKALSVHLPPEEKVSLQVMEAEVILTAEGEHQKIRLWALCQVFTLN